MKKLFLWLSVCLLSIFSMTAQQLAFPGAEGFGRYAVGGRYGSLYHVTNLNDSGKGSFRDAVSTPNRIIVFDVSGVIHLESTLVVENNITILGQTAPGEGVQVYGDRISFSGANDVIVRHMRFRMGIGGSSGKDAVGIANGKNMIFDHVSALWGRDENFSVSWDNKGTEPTNITIQNSIIGQGLQTHSCGGLCQTNGGVTHFRNLFIENKTRNPKVKGLHQYVNNVVYNWGNGGCYIMGDTEASSWADIRNNYFIKGPWDGATQPFIRGTKTFTYYGDGNYYDSNVNGKLDGTEIGHPYSGSTQVFDWATWDNSPYRPQAHAEIASLMTAEEAVAWIIDSVGPCLPVRDQVDQYLIDELESLGTKGTTNGITTERDLPHKGTGVLYGGYKPLDTDGDAIPDEWEIANGLNPNDASDAMAIAANGYTNIENYSFSIVEAYPYVKSPSSLRATEINKFDLLLRWTDNASDETAVIVEKSSDNSHFEVIATLPADADSFRVEGLTPETTYYFRVKALNGEILSVYSNVLKVATIGDPEQPRASVNPSPEDKGTFGASTRLKLTWENHTNPYGGKLYYSVFIGTNPDSLTQVARNLSATSFTYTKSLTEGTIYYWRVDAKNDLGETPGDVWSFEAVPGGQYFYSDFAGKPSAWAAAYGDISDNTNIINAENTTKTVAGMTFGSGSNAIRVVAMSAANVSDSSDEDYGPYTANDAGASPRCVQFVTTKSGGYLQLPEVQGPCRIVLYLGNPDKSSKTVNLKQIIKGTETQAMAMTMAAAKRTFKYEYVYAGSEKITFKIDANAKKFNINDVLLEAYVPDISEIPIEIASAPETEDFSYADGSMQIVFNQDIKYEGGLTINTTQYEQVKASASAKTLTITYNSLAPNTEYTIDFGKITDYNATKTFEGSYSFTTCDFPPTKLEGEKHYGKAASAMPLDFVPFDETAPFATIGGEVQTSQQDYPHWVQASGSVSANSVVMTSTKDKLMSYFEQVAHSISIKADFSGSNIVFNVQETRNADEAPYWRTIRQFTKEDFPIDVELPLDVEARFIKLIAPTLSGSLTVSHLVISDQEPTALETSQMMTVKAYSPVANVIRVEGLMSQSEVRVYNLLGECCYRQQVQGALDINMPSGLYIIRVQNENQDSTQKIIVQ